jgi:hypothetical protein
VVPVIVVGLQSVITPSSGPTPTSPLAHPFTMPATPNTTYSSPAPLPPYNPDAYPLESPFPSVPRNPGHERRSSWPSRAVGALRNSLTSNGSGSARPPTPIPAPAFSSIPSQSTSSASSSPSVRSEHGASPLQANEEDGNRTFLIYVIGGMSFPRVCP